MSARYHNWPNHCILHTAKRAVCKVSNEMRTRARVFVIGDKKETDISWGPVRPNTDVHSYSDHSYSDILAIVTKS